MNELRLNGFSRTFSWLQLTASQRCALLSSLFALSLSLIGASAHAQSASPDQDEDQWFFYVSSGIGRTHYDSDIDNRINAQKSQGGSTPQTGYFDIPAVYRRIASGLAAGAVAHLTFEHVARDWREQNSYAVHSYNPALSAIWFTQGRIGEGLFLRTDLGYGRILQIREFGDRFDRLNSDSVFWQGVLGYGLRAGSVASLLLHVNVSNHFGGPHNLQAANFNVGFLF